MSATDIDVLEKEVKKRKRIASEWAAKLHDLVEERLPAAYEEIPELAESVYAACKAWDEARSDLKSAQS